MNTQQTYRRFRNLFIFADFHLRFLGNPRIEHRFAIMEGYLKIWFWTIVQPRRTKPISILGFRVHYGTLHFLRPTYREIFMERLYRQPAGPVQNIIDGGANIGISLLWFKWHYPDATVVCFEPDPSTFAVLKRNIDDNRLSQVTAYQVALSDRDTTIKLFTRTAHDAGDTMISTNVNLRSAWEAGGDFESTEVPAKSLAPYLQEPVDILKLDIEGAEGAVLQGLANHLKRVRSIQMEYHYDPQSCPLLPLLKVLDEAGHHFEIAAEQPLQSATGAVAMIYTDATRRDAPG